MRKIYVVLVAFAALVLFACSKQSTQPAEQASLSPGDIPAEVQAKLDSYIVQDEDALASLAPGHPDLSDHFNDYDVYAVTYLWGSFFPMGGSPIVWDGRSSANAEAAIRVVTNIDFEEGEAIHFDSTQPSVFGWTSSTLNDLDGVSFLLFVKRGVVYVVPPVLAFETHPISFTIPIEALAHHASYHPVDHSSGVAVFARQIRNAPCPHGYLAGRWVFDENTRASGHFRGDWLSRDHQVAGALSGVFSTDTEGHHLFRGQVSDPAMEVFIELEGVWNLTPHLGNALCATCNNMGYFVGRWKRTDGSGGGKLAGNFGDPNLTSDTPELPFRGMWVEHCDFHAGDNSWSFSGQ
jgi:hypothetical protein